MKEYIDKYSSALKTAWWAFVGIIIMLFIAAALSGCTTTKYVDVEKVRDVHHWHTDSVIERDSTHSESITTIMQLDSAQMAKYGIQLKNAERAWLVKTKELEFQIQQLKALTSQKDSVHDSIPVPYPVEKLVEKKLSWFQQTEIWAGRVMLAILAGLVVYAILRIKNKFI